MKFRLIQAALLLATLSGSGVNAQAQTPSKAGNYDPHLAFSPLFYTQNGNEYRSASGSPGPKYWQNRADYTITANLDEEKNTLAGTVTINYKNNSPDQLPYIWLQLDQNIYKQDSRSAVVTNGSTYNGRAGGIAGGYQITGLSVVQNKIPVRFTELIDDTRMQIRLEQPLAASGGTLTLKMKFSFEIPGQGSNRMGRLSTKNGEIYAVAQWFPRLCVYDDVLGWNTMPYIEHGEFYCEYGDINYNITTPASHILMGSGELLNPEEVFTPEQFKRWNAAKLSDRTVVIRSAEEVTDLRSRPAKDRLTWRFRMANTRDVAWASSRAFVLDAAKINLPGGQNSMAVSAHPVESDGVDAYRNAVDYIKSTIGYNSKKWFRYPYPMAVNIACGVDGMEYPGIVFCGWKNEKAAAFGVMDHELGHSLFPIIVGSNERRFAWMDEGFNTFNNELSTASYQKGRFKDGMKGLFDAANAMANKEEQKIMSIPEAFFDDNWIYYIYSKPAQGLKILRNYILGPDRFDYAFKNYIKQWAYKHPTPYDFFRSMESGAGEDLAWFWRGWFLENWKTDQAVTAVTPVKKDGRTEGYDIVIANLEKMPMPVILQVRTASGKTDIIKIPVDVWMRNTSWTVRYTTAEELVSVVLDPEHVLPDADVSNNSWKK